MQNKLYSRIFSVLLSAAVILPAAGSAGFTAVAAESNWNTSVSIPSNDLKHSDVFYKAAAAYTGEQLTPLVCYGMQVVAGYNHYFICRQGDDLKKVTVYEDPAGAVSISSVTDFVLDDYAKDHSYYIPEEPECGGVELVNDLAGCQLPSDAATAFDKVYGRINGSSNIPVAYLGKQTNNGTDYAYLCETSAVVPDPDIYLNVLIIHEDSDGNAYPQSSYTLLGARTYYNIPEKPELVNTSWIQSGSINLGESITLNAVAEGGTGPYTYALMYKKSTSSTWSKIGTKYGTASTGSFKPGKAVPYDIMINVKDSTGKIKSKTFRVNVTASLKNTSKISADTVKAGDKVTLKASATGGTGSYTYALMYKKSTSSTWSKIGTKYGTASTGSFKPGKAVPYDIMINVKDSTGKIKSKTFTLTVK